MALEKYLNDYAVYKYKKKILKVKAYLSKTWKIKLDLNSYKTYKSLSQKNTYI